MPVSTSQQRADALVNLMVGVLAGGGLPATGGSREYRDGPRSPFRPPDSRADIRLTTTLKLQVGFPHFGSPILVRDGQC